MVNFFICDDDAQSLKILSKNLERIIEDNNIDGRIVLETQKPRQVIDKVKGLEFISKDCNVYLLDVDLASSLNGLELARRIRLVDPIGYIIFVTAHIEYEMLVYKNFLKAYAYIIKPMQIDDFDKTILSAVQDFGKVYTRYSECGNNKLIIKAGYKTYYIDVDDIILFERANRKTNIYTEKGVYNTIKTLSDYSRALYKYKNIKKIHKSYMINEDAIKEVSYKNKQIIMKNGMKVPISRAQRAKFRKETKKS